MEWRLTCGAEAVKMVPVLPSGEEEASSQQNVLGLEPHRASRSVLSASAQFSHHAAVQIRRWSQPLGEVSTGAQISAAAGLLRQWPKHKSNLPHSTLLLQLSAVSPTH